MATPNIVSLDKSSSTPNSGAASLSKAEKLRQSVIEIALKHFAIYGFEGASIRQIAKEAGTSHTLIVYHFNSKEDLWYATMDATIGAYVKSIVDDLSTEADDLAAPALHKFIERFVRMSAQTPEVHRIMTMAESNDRQRINWLIESHLKAHFDFVVNLIRKGQQEGSVRHCDPVRLYFHIIGAGGTPFTLANEFKVLTGRDVFSETEIYHTIAFIFEIVFVNGST